jgi:high affinity sulfate transporter 1
MAGSAIIIALQQLKGFLGIVHFTKKSDIISVTKSVGENAHHGVRASYLSYIVYFYSGNQYFRQLTLASLIQWNWQTLLIAASFLAFLLATKHIVR